MSPRVPMEPEGLFPILETRNLGPRRRGALSREEALEISRNVERALITAGLDNLIVHEFQIIRLDQGENGQGGINRENIEFSVDFSEVLALGGGTSSVGESGSNESSAVLEWENVAMAGGIILIADGIFTADNAVDVQGLEQRDEGVDAGPSVDHNDADRAEIAGADFSGRSNPVVNELEEDDEDEDEFDTGMFVNTGETEADYQHDNEESYLDDVQDGELDGMQDPSLDSLFIAMAIVGENGDNDEIPE